MFFTVFSFVSCDYYTTYTLCIDNKTNDTIVFYLSGQSKYIHGNNDSIVCLPQINNIYYNVNGRYVKDFTCSSEMNKDEIKVKIFSGKVLTKNIWESNNWDCNGNNKDGWKMIFIITENDLK
jgi:hypothetical protein